MIGGLPDWLIANLQALGRFNSDGIKRSAKMGTCPDCGRPILRGLDGDRAAMVAICDPYEIDLNGELIALALGLRTYSLTRTQSGSSAAWNLDVRLPTVCAQDNQRNAIVAAHRCGIAIPPTRRSFLPAHLNAGGVRVDRPPF